MSNITEEKCPICQHICLLLKNNKHWHCKNCDFIFLSPGLRLNFEEERNRYLLHKNDGDQVGYLQFLGRVMNKVLEFNLPFSTTNILDFGSGPNPVLSQLLKDKGFRVDIYDPFFAQDETIWGKYFDVIIMNEVLEHCFDPMLELLRLEKILKPHGVIIIQMKLHSGPEHLLNWWYARDPTHVSFFSRQTFQRGIPLALQKKIVLLD
jgi:hypothetical protein